MRLNTEIATYLAHSFGKKDHLDLICACKNRMITNHKCQKKTSVVSSLIGSATPSAINVIINVLQSIMQKRCDGVKQ